MTLSQWAGRLGVFALAVLFALGIVAVAPTPTPALAEAGAVTVEWFGWSHYRLTSPNGKVIHLNPFIDGNPDAAIGLDDITQADLILPADGHGDETGQTVAIAQKTGAKIFAPFELGTSFMAQGVPAAQVVRGGPGDRLIMDGITIRMVGSVHGSGLPLQDGSISQGYGGPAAGFYITFENGWTVYFTGSSAATQDQAMWGAAYKPDAMIFHMAAGHEPIDVANSIRLTMTDNPNLKTLLPHHHRVNQQPNGTWFPDVRAALDSMGISTPIT